MTAKSAEGRTALVATGGGARGAYQAGALTELLPALERAGARPTVYTGISAGAINVTGLAGTAHLSASEQAEILVERWQRAIGSHVLTRLWRQAPVNIARYLGEVLMVPRMRLLGFFEVAPLAKELTRSIAWDTLHQNVLQGPLDAVTVTATAQRTGRSVSFVEGEHTEAMRGSRSVDYVPTELNVSHVLGSAAVPMLFSPIEITEPPEAQGWYADGSIRLHRPLKPALDLGADRLVVVGTTSMAARQPEADESHLDLPDLADSAVTVLDALLEDSLVEDMRLLAAVNEFFAEDADAGDSYRATRGKQPYRRIPYMFVSPRRQGELASLALEVLEENYRGLKALFRPEFPVMNRLTGGNSPLQGQLLSYFLFDRDYIDESIRLGARDAREWLGDAEGAELWRTGQLPSLTETTGSNDAREHPPG
jgi:NTE family protein